MPILCAYNLKLLYTAQVQEESISKVKENMGKLHMKKKKQETSFSIMKKWMPIPKQYVVPPSPKLTQCGGHHESKWWTEFDKF